MTNENAGTQSANFGSGAAPSLFRSREFNWENQGRTGLRKELSNYFFAVIFDVVAILVVAILVVFLWA